MMQKNCQKSWMENNRFFSNIEHDIPRLKSLRIETMSSIWISQFRYVVFFFARLSNDRSTLGRWLLAVDTYFPTCYSSMSRCHSRESRDSRFLAKCSFCKLLSSVTANSDNEIAGYFPSRWSSDEKGKKKSEKTATPVVSIVIDQS